MHAFQVVLAPSNHHTFAARRCCACGAVPSSVARACTVTQQYQIRAADHLPRHFDQRKIALLVHIRGAPVQSWHGMHAAMHAALASPLANMHKRPLGRPPFVSAARWMVQIRPRIENICTHTSETSISDFARPATSVLHAAGQLTQHVARPWSIWRHESTLGRILICSVLSSPSHVYVRTEEGKRKKKKKRKGRQAAADVCQGSSYS